MSALCQAIRDDVARVIVLSRAVEEVANQLKDSMNAVVSEMGKNAYDSTASGYS